MDPRGHGELPRTPRPQRNLWLVAAAHRHHVPWGVMQTGDRDTGRWVTRMRDLAVTDVDSYVVNAGLLAIIGPEDKVTWLQVIQRNVLFCCAVLSA